jgi:hypothetical protein
MPKTPALVLSIIWYGSLLLIALYFSFEPKAEFNYLKI